jgi:hypothetical protein
VKLTGAQFCGCFFPRHQLKYVTSFVIGCAESPHSLCGVRAYMAAVSALMQVSLAGQALDGDQCYDAGEKLLLQVQQPYTLALSQSIWSHQFGVTGLFFAHK